MSWLVHWPLVQEVPGSIPAQKTSIPVENFFQDPNMLHWKDDPTVPMLTSEMILDNLHCHWILPILTSGVILDNLAQWEVI